jgi:hypothetical protein
MIINSFFLENTCEEHTNKKLNYICFDFLCKNKGLICANCLTINGKHKGHDTLEL